MKRFLFAALLGVTLFTVAGPVFAEVAGPQPRGLADGVVVTLPPDTTDWR